MPAPLFIWFSADIELLESIISIKTLVIKPVKVITIDKIAALTPNPRILTSNNATIISGKLRRNRKFVLKKYLLKSLILFLFLKIVDEDKLFEQKTDIGKDIKVDIKILIVAIDNVMKVFSIVVYKNSLEYSRGKNKKNTSLTLLKFIFERLDFLIMKPEKITVKNRITRYTVFLIKK